MRSPNPPEALVVHASNVAALSAAFAPLFDNDPATMGANGFILGFVTGLPVCVYAMVHRHRKGSR